MILKLTLETTVTSVPAFTGSHIFQVFGLGQRDWSETSVTWNTASWFTGGSSPAAAISGVNENVYLFGPPHNNSFIGHLSLEGTETAGTVLQLDITDYIRQVGRKRPTTLRKRRTPRHARA